MKRILIVDDHPEVRELVEVTFSLGDFDIHKAVNGGAALDDLRRNPADLVILDVMMPGGIDGFEVCKRIRNDEEFWDKVETYFGEHLDLKFSHGLCPECARKLYPDLMD